MDRLQLGEYFRDTLVDWFMGKGRRKEKDVTSLPSQESKRYLRPELLECCSPEYRLREIIQLPEGVNYNEWLASHCLAFFDHINLIYGTISEFCTTSGCPDMIGPNNRLYLWIDEKGKRCKLPAPQYIDYVMTYTQRTVNDESIFPTKFDKEFPSSFESIVKKIMLLLFHVMAHIYHSHFKEIELLNLHPQTNCIFAHFMLFNDQFMLIEEKEIEVLADLAVALKLFPPKPDDPNQNQFAMSPTPKTSDTECSSSSRISSNPVESGSFGDSSHDEQHHYQQQMQQKQQQQHFSQHSHQQVISAQCRSISPFINSSNSYSEDMTVDDNLPENSAMDVTMTEEYGEHVVTNENNCTPLRTHRKNNGDDDCCMSTDVVKSDVKVPLASSSDPNTKTYCEVNRNSAMIYDVNFTDDADDSSSSSPFVHSQRRCSSASAILSTTQGVTAVAPGCATTITATTSTPAGPVKSLSLEQQRLLQKQANTSLPAYKISRRSHSNGSPVNLLNRGSNNSELIKDENRDRLPKASTNLTYFSSIVPPSSEPVFPMDSVSFFGGSPLTTTTAATATASASLSPQQFQ